MNVSIKQFDVNMNIKKKGIELDVYDPSGEHLGDLVITMTQLIWCPGRTTRKNGKAITWKAFIELMAGR